MTNHFFPRHLTLKTRLFNYKLNIFPKDKKSFAREKARKNTNHIPTGIQNIEETSSLTKPVDKNLFSTSWSPRVTAKLNCDSEAIRQTSVYLHFKKSAPRANKVATYFLRVRLFRCFQ